MIKAINMNWNVTKKPKELWQTEITINNQANEDGKSEFAAVAGTIYGKCHESPFAKYLFTEHKSLLKNIIITIYLRLEMSVVCPDSCCASSSFPPASENQLWKPLNDAWKLFSFPQIASNYCVLRTLRAPQAEKPLKRFHDKTVLMRQ